MGVASNVQKFVLGGVAMCALGPWGAELATTAAVVGDYTGSTRWSRCTVTRKTRPRHEHPKKYIHKVWPEEGPPRGKTIVVAGENLTDTFWQTKWD